MSTLTVGPPGPQLPPPAAPDPFTGNPASDWFSNVVRPSRFNEEEIRVASELRANIVEWESADGDFLKNANFEFDFLSGLQWMDEYGERGDRAKELERKGRNAFTIDLLTPSVDIVVNQIRINKLMATFIPMGGQASKPTAEVRQGLYRNIERVSKAAIARETAYQMAVSVGRGYERILIEDEPGASFQRKITIQRVDSLESVAIDPTCLDFCYSDAQWAYTYDQVWKDQYQTQYGKTPDGEDFDLDLYGMRLLDDQARNWWFPKNKITVGEYWRRVWKMRTVWRLDDHGGADGNGTVCWKEDAPKGAQPARDGGVSVKSKMDSTLEWRRMSGTQTLEKRIWPGKLIPIVVFVGREVFRGKKPKIHSGMVRAAMAPCRIHNYMVSRTVDAVALSPLPHMFAPEESFSPEQAKIINDINSHPWSIIYYSPKQDDAGRQLPPPQWASPAANIAPIVQATAEAKDDLQRVLNTYAPQLGQEQGKQSGTAINQIKESGDISHAAFPDNYNRALTQEAEIVNELMDVVYTEKQALTITDLDQRTRQVLINQEYEDPRSGKTVNHLFGGDDSKYGVEIAPFYPSSKIEAATRILDLAKAMPAEVAKVMDLLVQDLNIPNAQKYADRWRPPGFTDDEDGPDITQVTQQRDQALQLANQAHGLIQQLLQKVQELGNKDAIERLKIASKERIAAAGDMALIVASEVKAGQNANLAALNGQIQGILSELDKATDVEAAAQMAEIQANQPEDGAGAPGGGTPGGGTPSAPAGPTPPAGPAPDGTGPGTPQ